MPLRPASHSSDLHRADGLTSCSSADSHRADTMVALLSYNVGIHTAELTGKKKNWQKVNGKYDMLKNDVENAFTHDTGIQILLISEFGHMFNKISNAAEIFTTMLAELDLTHIHFEAMAPYVALIDKTSWQVKNRKCMTKLCDHPCFFVQHLVVQHVDTGELLRIFNAHMPKVIATSKRKETCVQKMCETATATFGNGVSQPTAAIPWVIVGDLNVDAGTMMKWCQPFVEKNVACMSTSGWPHTRGPQKADIAISRGLALIQVKSWIGWHSQPCASDTHDAVVVMGALNQDQTVHDVKKEKSSPSWAIPGIAFFPPSNQSSGDAHPIPSETSIEPNLEECIQEIVEIAQADNDGLSGNQSSGDTHPVANRPTPKVTADVIESGQGESKQLSQKDALKVMTTPASQYVGNERSGDAHSVASETSIEPKSGQSIQINLQMAQTDVILLAKYRNNALSGNQSSGDTHPAACETSIEPMLEECIQEIVEIAQADNGALLEGDSPHATRYETKEVRVAAQDLLATLYSCMGGYAIRTEQEVLQAMTKPIRQRQQYINALAASRGVSQPADGRCVYTQNELLHWYAKMPLSESDMDAAVSQWKNDFPMNRHSLEKIEAWEEEGTRTSKKQAKSLRHGAFAAYLQQECIAKQLAMSFLRFPSATVHTLLQHWAEYMKSADHAKEKARAQTLDPGNAEAVREKEQQQKVKLKVHSLRHQIRQMKALHQKKWYNEMSSQQQQQHTKWRSGDMERELQSLTLEHGYGKLPLGKGILLPTRLSHTAT